MGKARAKYIKMSPRKIALVLDRIRGKKVDEAYRILNMINKRATLPVKKILDSAVANSNAQENTDKVKVKAAWVGQGPSLKRLRPRAQGRADIYKRRTAHIEIEVQ